MHSEGMKTDNVVFVLIYWMNTSENKTWEQFRSQGRQVTTVAET